MRSPLGAAVHAGLAVAAIAVTPATHAAPSVVPGSCASFDEKYFHSGRYQFAHYTLAGHVTNIGSSIGVVSYSEGTLHQSANPEFLEGDGLQYFNDRRYAVDFNLYPQPFNHAATDLLTVVLSENTPSKSAPAQLGGTFILDGWGRTREDFVAQGCIGDNVLYTTVGNSLISIALGVPGVQ